MPLMRRVLAGERQGTLTMRSTFDDKVRTIAFRVLDDYPMFVAAGIERATVVAAWRKDMALLAALLFPASGAMVAASWLALQRARREHAALERLRREVEQRLRAEAALVKAQKLQALGQITGSVAHDFNNLLAVVANSAQVIRRRLPAGEAPPPIGHSLDAVDRAVRNGVHLTRQLLAFSRRQALQPVDLDLRTTLPRTLELLRTSVGSRVRLEMTVASDLAAVRIDEADLELALLNLVLNARDAMPNGGVVHIDATNDRLRSDRAAGAMAAPDAVRISVRDDGCGIDATALKRVFEPFFTTKSETNGTGLGLSQVRAACEQAGGQVTIESRPGAGTTVTLCLPALVGPAPAPVPAAREAKINAVVLVVEDEIDVAHTTSALLEAFGARVRHAASVAEALALIELEPHAFDVVLSDVVMPGPDNGLSLARRLRCERPELPVVLMTGFTADLQTATAEGFAIVLKPCEPALLSRTLADAARRPE
jgi:signal transduction histidine kinase